MAEKTDKDRARKRAQNKRYYARTANIYPRRPWTEEELQMVVAHAEPDSQLSKKIHRSIKTIQQKRLVLKKQREAQGEA